MPRKPKEPTSLQRARKAHADRMREAGFRPKTFWLAAGTIETLERLTKAGGTSEAATVAHALAKLDEAQFQEAKTSAALVEIQTLDVDAEHRLPGPVKPATPKLDTSAVAVHPSLQKGKAK